MNVNNDTSRSTVHAPGEHTPGGGRAFRRTSTFVAACALAGSLTGIGATAALAATPRTASPTTSTTSTSATKPTHVTTSKPAPAKTYPPKATYTAADVRAFLKSAYADDALNLAVVWGTPDLATAKGKAGAKLRAGRALPFTPAKATIQPWTAEQQLDAFTLGDGDYAQALAVATVWGTPDVLTAKSKIGADLLAHESTPVIPKTFTSKQDVLAFHLAGYDKADAKQLAALWHSGSVHSAEVRAGKDLLAGQDLPI